MIYNTQFYYNNVKVKYNIHLTHEDTTDQLVINIGVIFFNYYAIKSINMGVSWNLCP